MRQASFHYDIASDTFGPDDSSGGAGAPGVCSCHHLFRLVMQGVIRPALHGKEERIKKTGEPKGFPGNLLMVGELKWV